MNLSPDWAVALGHAGLDAVHWSAVGPQDAPDDAIMVRARMDGRVVLTRDLDFGAALVLQARQLPSVIQLRIRQAAPERHLVLVRRAITLHGAVLGQGAIVTVREQGVRVRRLSSDGSSEPALPGDRE